MSWEDKVIGDLGKIVTGKTPQTANREFYDGDFLFVTPTDLDWQSYFVRSTHSTVTRLAKDRLKNQFIPAGSTTFTCIGNTIGKCGLTSEICLTNQQINSIVPNENHDPKFVYYLMIHNCDRIRSIGLGGGAAQPIINKSTFSAVKVRVPDLLTQQRIAGILSAYDDLIENNRRRIGLLEQAARLLYREWFVHLRFPGHETAKIVDGLPAGWERTTPSNFIIADIGGGWGQDEPNQNESAPAYVIRGTDIPDLQFGGKGGAGLRFHKPKSLESRVLSPSDVVFEVSGGSATQPIARTLHTTERFLSRFGGPVICASFCKKLTCSTEADAAFLHRHVVEERDTGRVLQFQKESASSLKNFNFSGFMSSYEILIPELSLREMFYHKLAPMIAKQELLAQEINALTRARDLLLPRLMDGRIPV